MRTFTLVSFSQSVFRSHQRLGLQLSFHTHAGHTNRRHLLSELAATMSCSNTQNKTSASSENDAPEHKKHKRTASGSQPPFKKQKISIEDQRRHLDHSHVPSGWQDTAMKQDAKQHSLQLTYHQGDMFAEVPPDTVLVHACNTQGQWGAGIAKAFKQKYPNAYTEHHDFCAKKNNKSNPLPTGTAQLLAPRDGDQQHWIGCVFTSAKYGKGKDKPDQIIKNTAKSVPMLLELISQVDEEVSTIRMCKINSGKFGVSWEKTEEVLRNIDLKPHWRTTIEIWEPEED
jgi:ADP-ribose 1''-phosphate phosphatase